MTTNMDTQDKKNTDLLLSIDALDGKTGDSTGMESQILSKIFNLDAEKKEETIKRMISLREVEMKLQSGYQKRNLLAGMKSSDISTQEGLFDTIKKLERTKLRIMRFAEVKDSKNVSGDIAARQEILKKHTGLETVRASDILMLKKQGADLAKLLLVPEKDSFATVSRETLKPTDSFIVNFGENKNLNNIIGAGDILPATVNRVKINGVEGERKYTPRPGYYEQPNDVNKLKKERYLPIYDGDKVEIIDNTGKVDAKVEKDSEDKWLHERRIEDMIDNNGTALSELPEDKKLEEEAQEEIKQQEERRKKWEKYNPESKNHFLETFGEVLDRETSKYRIPKDMLVNNLFEKENRYFDYTIKNPGSSAYGLGQIIDGTWKTIGYRLGRHLDRKNPEDQIIATCEYLNYIKNFRECSWGEAIVYYHAGEHFSDQYVRGAMEKNSPIVKYMQDPENPTARDYVAAAAKYYGVTAFMST